MPIKQEISQHLTGQWQIGLFETPAKVPATFCYGCCCPCCMIYSQRNEILDMTGEPYVCCGGLCPCGPLGEPQDKNCLFLEVCCCTSWALAGNRYMIQTRFDKENTPCDDCILWTICCVDFAICILQCAGIDIPSEIENCVDFLEMIVVGCMLGQQQNELAFVKQNGGYRGPNPTIIGVLSPHQQRIMQQAKPPVQQGMVVGQPVA